MDIPILVTVVRGSPGIKSGTKDLSDCTHTYEQAERLLFFSLAFQASACRMNAKIFETHDNSLYWATPVIYTRNTCTGSCCCITPKPNAQTPLTRVSNDYRQFLFMHLAGKNVKVLSRLILICVCADCKNDNYFRDDVIGILVWSFANGCSHSKWNKKISCLYCIIDLGHFYENWEHFNLCIEMLVWHF